MIVSFKFHMLPRLASCVRRSSPFRAQERRIQVNPRMSCLPLVRSYFSSQIMWLGWGSSGKIVSTRALPSLEARFTNLPLATSHCDVHKSASVSYSLLGPTLWCLLLLLWLDLEVAAVSILICWHDVGKIAEARSSAGHRSPDDAHAEFVRTFGV